MRNSDSGEVDDESSTNVNTNQIAIIEAPNSGSDSIPITTPIPNTTTINSSNNSSLTLSEQRKRKKQLNSNCGMRSIFEKYGSLYIFDIDLIKICISKLRVVNFPIKKVTFERGKIKSPKLYGVETDSIPDIKFWNQRYYYYSRFDEGVMMDYESKY